MQIWKEGNLKISIKNKQELESMRYGGKILGLILNEIKSLAKPGISTGELDKFAHTQMIKFGVKPSFLNYQGFPAVICTSINEEIVHGIPSPKRILTEGDILTVDCGVYFNGLHTDAAITVGIGEISPETQKFIDTCQKALEKAISIAKPGIRIRTISKIIQNTVEKQGYGVVRELVGHGIGEKLHEDPHVPNFTDSNSGPILQPGMTIAIEPIITMGQHQIKIKKDGWTYITKDGSLAAQIEHTIAITPKGAEILTTKPSN